jgi:hypothetical protein
MAGRLENPSRVDPLLALAISKTMPRPRPWSRISRSYAPTSLSAEIAWSLPGPHRAPSPRQGAGAEPPSRLSAYARARFPSPPGALLSAIGATAPTRPWEPVARSDRRLRLPMPYTTFELTGPALDSAKSDLKRPRLRRL